MGTLYIRRLQNKIAYRAKKTGFNYFIFIILIGVLIFCSSFLYTGIFLPTLNELATAQAYVIGQTIINSSAQEVMSSESFSTLQIVNFERNENGDILAAVPNLYAINKLKSEISLNIQNKLHISGSAKVQIPWGNLTGIPLLSNFGPKCTIDFIPVGKVLIDFDSSFTDAGINQTRHQIFVTIKLDTALLMPGNRSQTSEVNAKLPLYDTIIVGEVPSNFTNVESDPENYKSDLLNLIK